MEASQDKLGAVLIVEDMPRFWHPLKSQLVRSGLFSKVRVAQNIPEAEYRFETLKPLTAVLMDACLSGDDPDTLDLIRKMRETYGGIIIAMSRAPEYRRMQIDAGCSHESEKESAATCLLKLLSSSK